MIDGIKVYFDTMLYLDMFCDPYVSKPETANMFRKVKTGEFRLIISQTVMMEIYHVLCLPVAEERKFDNACRLMDEINETYGKISERLLSYPNTEFAKQEFNKIDSSTLIEFVKTVPGSSLIDFHGKKLPGSMDFIHIMIAVKLGCKKFFTEDKGVLSLDANQRKGDMKIIKPYKE